jgi:hypothetical protein
MTNYQFLKFNKHQIYLRNTSVIKQGTQNHTRPIILMFSALS